MISTSRPALGFECGPQPITIQEQDPGDTSGEAIPVPIPNTEVKLSSAEDTERAAFREHRSSPGFCDSREACSRAIRAEPLLAPITAGYPAPVMSLEPSTPASA